MDLDFTEINIDNIGYGHPQKTAAVNDKQAYNVPVNYRGQSPIIFETCELITPYAIDLKSSEGGKRKGTMKCEILDPQFVEFLNEIDERNLDVPFDREWYDEEDEENIFYHRPMFKKDEKYYIRVKIPIRHNIYQFKVFKKVDSTSSLDVEEFEPSSAMHITFGTRLRFKLEWKWLWIIDKKFGYYLTVKEIYILG